MAKTTIYPPVKNAEVHVGFWDAYLSIANETIAQIDNLRKKLPEYQLFVTGHSLGGALSTIVVLELARLLNISSNEIEHYTFGCPRVGNEVFANYFKTQIQHSYRVVNSRDIIPHLPPMFLNFWHTAREIWYYSDNFNVCDDTGEDESCSDSLWVALSVYDHIDYFGTYMGSLWC